MYCAFFVGILAGLSGVLGNGVVVDFGEVTRELWVGENASIETKSVGFEGWRWDNFHGAGGGGYLLQAGVDAKLGRLLGPGKGGCFANALENPEKKGFVDPLYFPKAVANGSCGGNYVGEVFATKNLTGRAPTVNIAFLANGGEWPSWIMGNSSDLLPANLEAAGDMVKQFVLALRLAVGSAGGPILVEPANEPECSVWRNTSWERVVAYHEAVAEALYGTEGVVVGGPASCDWEYPYGYDAAHLWFLWDKEDGVLVEQMGRELEFFSVHLFSVVDGRGEYTFGIPGSRMEAVNDFVAVESEIRLGYRTPFFPTESGVVFSGGGGNFSGGGGNFSGGGGNFSGGGGNLSVLEQMAWQGVSRVGIMMSALSSVVRPERLGFFILPFCPECQVSNNNLVNRTDEKNWTLTGLTQTYSMFGEYLPSKDSLVRSKISTNESQGILSVAFTSQNHSIAYLHNLQSTSSISVTYPTKPPLTIVHLLTFSSTGIHHTTQTSYPPSLPPSSLALFIFPTSTPKPTPSHLWEIRSNITLLSSPPSTTKLYPFLSPPFLPPNLQPPISSANIRIGFAYINKQVVSTNIPSVSLHLHYKNGTIRNTLLHPLPFTLPPPPQLSSHVWWGTQQYPISNPSTLLLDPSLSSTSISINSSTTIAISSAILQLQST